MPEESPGMRSMSSLGCSEATVAVDAVVAAFKSAGQAAVVAVADQQRKLILLARLDGAPYPSILIAMARRGPWI
jgi:glc operon protein GlcG